MASHKFHAREGDRDPVLFDGCERCEEHAELGGLDLDAETFARAWRLMIAVEKDDTEAYRSAADGILCGHLYRMAVLMERHLGLNPWVYPPTIWFSRIWFSRWGLL